MYTSADTVSLSTIETAIIVKFAPNCALGHSLRLGSVDDIREKGVSAVPDLG